MAYRQKQTYAFPDVQRETITKIITSNDAETLVKLAEEMGKALASPKEGDRKKLSTSQIRAIFGEVRRIEGKWESKEDRDQQWAKRQLILLKPKMAYRKEKEKNLSVRRLVDTLTWAIDDVDGKEENFTRFVDFFEAILAYHKAAGGN